jgi:hypothetical protein
MCAVAERLSRKGTPLSAPYAPLESFLNNRPDSMGRPKTPAERKMTRVLTAKLTPPQEEAWDKLRSAVGGGGLILPRDSDVLRFVIAEACKRFGVARPGEQTSVPSH